MFATQAVPTVRYYNRPNGHQRSSHVVFREFVMAKHIVHPEKDNGNKRREISLHGFLEREKISMAR